MSDVNQFRALIVPTTLFGNTDTYNTSSMPFMPNGAQTRATMNVAETRCGALTSNTYKTVVSVSGRGLLNFAGFVSLSSGIYSFGFRLTYDGIVIERTGVPNNDFTSKGLPVIGGVIQDLTNTTVSGLRFDPLPFNSGFTIEVKSTQAVTDGIGVITNYRILP